MADTKLLEFKGSKQKDDYTNRDTAFVTMIGRFVIKVATYGAVVVAIGAGAIALENLYLENRCTRGSWVSEQITTHNPLALPLELGYSNHDRLQMNGLFDRLS